VHRETPHSPKADAIIIAQATFDTVNKLTNGIADNYVLDVANETLDFRRSANILSLQHPSRLTTRIDSISSKTCQMQR
jgi:flavoprotein